ncbi:MAG: hypothetical protein ACLGJC_21305 [Alphaproteobacteria bacterium]
MADKQTVFPVISKPGIKRDGTVFEGDGYVDGQWVRWQRGFPRKIGGFRQITRGFSGPARALHVHPVNGRYIVHQCSATAVQRVALSADGFGDGVINRTPSGLTATQARSWQIATMWDPTGAGTPRIFAYAARNLDSISSDAAGVTYWGDISGTDPLTTATGIPPLSGGICVVPPFMFAFGSDGRIAWSDEGLPNTFTGGASGAANITNAKIVAMRPLRSPGGQAPAALIWTLDSLYRATYVGDPAIFSFDSLSDESSILSPSSIVEMDGVFYWLGTDRFCAFNGVVREIPNEQNRDWFFGTPTAPGLNYAARTKVWGVKVPRFGEIWWFHPRGDATECTHVLIYNVREQCWYDSEIGRAAGFYSQVFPFPIMASATSLAGSTATGFALWQHELGTDRVEGNKTLAIQSFYETGDIAYANGGPMHSGWTGVDRWVRIYRIEPDFIQQGPMRVSVLGRAYARGATETDSYDFEPGTEKVDMKNQRRELRLRFESNVQGGYYEAGQTLAHLDVGDGRQGR